ncbi:MAG: HipA family kinase [Micropepsaceae bacterium]
MHTYQAKRILRAERKSSSSPVIVDTDGGAYFVKLRGAAQGTLALVAEIIVANLAEAIGLSVPSRALVTLDKNTPTDAHNDELLQLVAMSHGLNLGFQYLDGARDLRADEAHLIDSETAAKIVWLDALVTNPDRTSKNPNIIWWHDKPWLIDHGAALGFQHDWSRVDEQTARRPFSLTSHYLIGRATKLEAVDTNLADRITREIVDDAVGLVPDDFLRPHLGDVDLKRRRQAYAAVLWKRLKAPRPWSQQ